MSLLPALTLGVFALPIAAGLGWTLLPAFGWLPAVGASTIGLAAWQELGALPGLATAVRLTLTTGISATLSSLLIALLCAAALHGTPTAARVRRWLAPILSTPHSAMAIGFAFLIAPSGWLVRAISPGLTGWDLPPDVATVGDAHGMALMAGLVIKEVPWLLLMIFGALRQVPAAAHVRAAQALGESPAAGWLKVVLPQVYPQLRLPVLATLAFSMSAVDVALVLGPGQPPTLPVLALRLLGDPDLRMQLPGSAAAVLHALLVGAAILGWLGCERLAGVLGRRWVMRGPRGDLSHVAASAGSVIARGSLLAALASIAGLALWSVAARWRYPAALPQDWTLSNWQRRLPELHPLAADTLLIALASTLLAAALSIMLLEAGDRLRVDDDRTRRLQPLLYLPLLVPQVSFMFGVQVLLVRLALDGRWGAVVAAHLLFVFPYLLLSLADPWRALDRRYARSATALGASAWRVLWRIKLPMLLRPLSIACAVGFGVSVAQYLPTVFAGNGQIATLTTEAVTLSAGADRRLMGVHAFAQALMPLIAYGVALLLPALIHRRRAGMVDD